MQSNANELAQISRSQCAVAHGSANQRNNDGRRRDSDGAATATTAAGFPHRPRSFPQGKSSKCKQGLAEFARC
eukprot:6326938-Pyramimonas_sp.AAC.1